MNAKKFTGLYRFMHWSIAICMVLLLITIFLRLSWMNKYHMAEIIGDYLVKHTDFSLSDDELIVLAKKIRKPMWDWHIYLGYVVTGLFSIRFLLPLFGKMKFSNPFEKGITTLERVRYSVYIIFYLCIVVSLVTGLMITLGPPEMKKTMEAIHKPSIYYLVVYIVLHLISVFVAEFTYCKGIISDVISGKKNGEE